MSLINLLSKTLNSMILGLLALLLSTAVMANQPFYFVAKQAPLGSLTLPGMSSDAVYLRWDLIEGDLPADIVSFDLYRDSVLIKNFPAGEVISTAEISRLYAASAQQRRLVETVSLLKEEALQDDSVDDFSANDYAQVIRDRLQSDNYWAQLASRRDFNLAIARNRAYIDQPGSGSFSYELRAKNSQGDSRRVGLVSVDTSQTQTLLATPAFEQLALSQCDMPDIKDHYSVALNWLPAGGNNMADRVANRLFVSGFDLYRSRENVDSTLTQAPIRDLAAEAKGLSFDAKGQVAFSDLQKVNETLITVSPDTDASNPEWLETQDDLSAAGLKPGDTRAYYLVARDFTGNFGPTIGAIVRVGDMSRPPAPWDIDVYLSEASQRVELSFEEFSTDSWLESFGGSKRVCDISDSGAISFVGRDQSCAEQRHNIIQTDVSDYLLYRFENFADASSFKDSDGDGFSNKTERPAGLQCVAAATTGNATNGGFLVDSEFDIEEVSEDYSKVTVADVEPAQNKGDVYWYRLAAEGINGRLSFLSEPVRVNFPDRTLPDAPEVSLTHPGDRSEFCDCKLEYVDDSSAWKFSTNSGLLNDLNFSCDDQSYDLDPKSIAGANSSTCLSNFDFVSNCQLGGVISSNTKGLEYCSVSLPDTANFCGTGTMQLKHIPCEEVDAPVGVIEGPLNITVTALNPNHCVSLYQQVAGQTLKVSTSCGEESPASDTHVIERGEFCGYAVSHDENNNISTTTRIDCREVINPDASVQILSPRIDNLQLGDEYATVRVDLPTQVQSLIEVELVQEKPNLQNYLIQREGIASGEESTVNINFDIPELLGANDQWCVRARIHGISAEVGESNVSDWTAKRCELRSSSVLTQPQWLSWPGLNTAEQGEDFVAYSNEAFGSLPSLSPILTGVHIPLLDIEHPCDVASNTVTWLDDVGAGDLAEGAGDLAEGAALINLVCNEREVNAVRSAYNGELNFLVFRQTRINGVVSNFQQVSPLINYGHWVDAGTEKDVQLLRLKDPYLWASLADTALDETVTISYVDRAPVMVGSEYRYQFVFFDAKHALSSWRQTQWVTVNSTTTTDGGSNP